MLNAMWLSCDSSPKILIHPFVDKGIWLLNDYDIKDFSEIPGNDSDVTSTNNLSVGSDHLSGRVRGGK